MFSIVDQSKQEMANHIQSQQTKRSFSLSQTSGKKQDEFAISLNSGFQRISQHEYEKLLALKGKYAPDLYIKVDGKFQKYQPGM